MLYLFEDYVFDTDQRELRRGARLISLQPQVFDLLEYLIRNRERVVTKDDLFGAIWGGRIVSESALTTRINAARTAIGDNGEQPLQPYTANWRHYSELRHVRPHRIRKLGALPVEH